jgi:hypothetical protein
LGAEICELQITYSHLTQQQYSYTAGGLNDYDKNNSWLLFYAKTICFYLMFRTFSYFLIEETNVSMLESAIFGVQTISASLLCRFINWLDFHQTHSI